MKGSIDLIRLKPNAKIYVITPAFNTGGPKTLHQFVSKLSQYYQDVFIVYSHDGKVEEKHDPIYDFPGLKVTDQIEDDIKNVIIVPETNTGILKKYKNIRPVIWWLSVDFYYNDVWTVAKRAVANHHLNEIFTPLAAVYIFLKHPNHFLGSKKVAANEMKNVYHLYNCEYARQFLLKNGVSEDKMRYLCGPLENAFFKLDYDEIKNFKKDYIVYNPAKMNVVFLEKIQQRLRDQNYDFKFIPIVNMNRNQVFETLRGAKLYVDFGFFPGPERMPREAAALYCNIITSNKGSAANDIDVTIPRENKFSLSDKNIPEICNRMVEMIKHYDDYVGQVDRYRKKVWEQIDKFDENVRDIFDK